MRRAVAEWSSILLTAALPAAVLLADCSKEEVIGTTAADSGIAGPSDAHDAAVDASTDGADALPGKRAEDAAEADAAEVDPIETDAACGVAPTCGWLHQSQGGGNAYPTSLDVDPAGHVILSGDFAGEVSFGGSTFSYTPGEAGFDIFDCASFVSKFSPSGQHEWSRRIATGNLLGSAAIMTATDATGGIVLAGTFETLELGGKTTVSQGTSDVFIARLTAGGSDVWAKTYGGAAQFQGGAAVTVDATGNAVAAGSFNGTIDFGDGPRVGSTGGQSAFLVKVDSAGATKWSSAFTADVDAFPGVVRPHAVAVDASGAIFLAGLYQGSVDLGGGALPLTPPFWVFVAKFDADGKHLFSKGFGSTALGANVGAVSMKVDAAGHVVLAGSFASDIDFGGGPLSASSGLGALFIAKLDASGSHIWSYAFGNSKSQVWPTVALGAAGDVWLGGVVYSSMTVGSCTAIGNKVGANGGSGLFAHFDQAGHPLWARGLGLASQGGSFVATGPMGELVVAGWSGGTFDLGCGPITSTHPNAFWGRLTP